MHIFEHLSPANVVHVTPSVAEYGNKQNFGRFVFVRPSKQTLCHKINDMQVWATPTGNKVSLSPTSATRAGHFLVLHWAFMFRLQNCMSHRLSLEVLSARVCLRTAEMKLDAIRVRSDVTMVEATSLGKHVAKCSLNPHWSTWLIFSAHLISFRQLKNPSSECRLASIQNTFYILVSKKRS